MVEWTECANMARCFGYNPTNKYVLSEFDFYLTIYCRLRLKPNFLVRIDVVKADVVLDN